MTKEERRSVGVDRFLKWVMPNLTVIRRFVFGSWTLKVILILLLIVLTSRVEDNTRKVELAACAVTDYAAEQSETLRNPPPPGRPNVPAAARLDQLSRDMRATGIRCPPPPGN